MNMNIARLLACFGIVFILVSWAFAEPSGEYSVRDGWVTVIPREFHGAINNPLKGFRAYKKNAYGLIERKYIKWSDIEMCADDTVERIIAYTNKITEIDGKRFEDLNVKLVPRVYLDWNGSAGKQYWPEDLQTFDYDSPTFQERLRRLVEKLGQAWDNDPRIFAVQMGLIGYFGEHHNPAPTPQQRRLLGEAFQKAFKNKPILVRHTNPEFMEAGFGIYYDTFANLDREPPHGSKKQFPWQATYVYPNIWKVAPIEGEVEYYWQNSRPSAKPDETFGRAPNETMKVPAFRRYMIDKIRRYHASYLGWISGYDDTDPDVVAGAAELQKVFGYRFVLDSVSYPLRIEPGGEFIVKFSVRNTGSAPFYLDWPVAVGLLNPATKRPVWFALLKGIDLRRWLPGEDWQSDTFAYRVPAKVYSEEGRVTVPEHIPPGRYIMGLAILDRQCGMLPSARFAVENYFRGGWHPFGFIGVGQPPDEPALKGISFDSPAFDDSLHYTVPEELRRVGMPPPPSVKPVTPWTPDPSRELINPWRYWTLDSGETFLEKEVYHNGPVEGPAGRRVIQVKGAFGPWATLNYTFPPNTSLSQGCYRLSFLVRGTPKESIEIDLAENGQTVAKVAQVQLEAQWRSHTVEFELTKKLDEKASLRFRLPRNIEGTIELTDAHLKHLE